MLHFQIDTRSGIPVYRQVMDQVRYYVAAGTLAPDAQLPSIRALARALSINPTTVVKAYGELEHDGVIELRHGKGAFVTRAARRTTERTRRAALRRLARTLAVEAVQMGATPELVAQIVTDEVRKLTGGAPAGRRRARRKAHSRTGGA